MTTDPTLRDLADAVAEIAYCDVCERYAPDDCRFLTHDDDCPIGRLIEAARRAIQPGDRVTTGEPYDGIVHSVEAHVLWQKPAIMSTMTSVDRLTTNQGEPMTEPADTPGQVMGERTDADGTVEVLAEAEDR